MDGRKPNDKLPACNQEDKKKKKDKNGKFCLLNHVLFQLKQQ